MVDVNLGIARSGADMATCPWLGTLYREPFALTTPYRGFRAGGGLRLRF